ncbi:type II toxin-antitoxin system PemK/MazF family toxin [Cellulomonas sp. S1-8]|uniref:type II toxin-antitoxin system PemK/MazF family toxin n=1 Tax=Cellulomonas sp. S1-8 TaxID=2904790 RepID=UPI002243B2E5|nr:type II toxin-antitoxin system PemK/MazF family toxin [Cellulomonas sp. S1-8]UZN02649.1 type II toxin-antitoxin system PemK/MazF family toxin [Cellulomonas sp. S1-8]
MRGDVHRVRAPADARGHEQREDRFAVVVLASRFDHLSTWLVVPTSTRANTYVFRPEIEVPGHGPTLALCDALTAVDPQARLGEHVGYLTLGELQRIDEALTGLLDL